MSKKIKFIIIITAVLFIIFSANIYSSIQSYKYRRLCNQYRESLIATEEENRELADRIGRIAEITGRIKEAADANITDARSIIETVEMLRTQIQELENICYGSNSIDSYYSYWDNIYGLEQ